MALKPALPNNDLSSGEGALSYLNCEGRDSLRTVVLGNITAASPIGGQQRGIAEPSEASSLRFSMYFPGTSGEQLVPLLFTPSL